VCADVGVGPVGGVKEQSSEMEGNRGGDDGESKEHPSLQSCDVDILTLTGSVCPYHRRKNVKKKTDKTFI
jgi:hypothetical protein